jgi:hypothetical protein
MYPFWGYVTRVSGQVIDFVNIVRNVYSCIGWRSFHHPQLPPKRLVHMLALAAQYVGIGTNTHSLYVLSQVVRPVPWANL